MAWIKIAQKVKAEHQHRYVNADTGAECKETDVGAVAIDAQTANMLVSVHDALSEKNRAHFTGLTLVEAVDLGWKVIQKSKES